MLFKSVADTIKQKTKWVFTTALFFIILIHIDFFIINPCFLYFQAPLNYAATAKAEEYSRSEGYGVSGKSFLVPSINYKMIYIPPGSFIMGSPQSEKGRDSDETQHKVIFTKAFYIGVTEVTQGQWQTVMGKNPSIFKDSGDDCPVEMGEVNEYIYRLPTEAEWEYACRAGSTTAFAGGDITETECGLEPHLANFGWYCGNSEDRVHPVAQTLPNAFGLYDMHGNVWEWCQDWYGQYPSGEVTAPQGPSSGSNRVPRGGGWDYRAEDCRSANRYGGPAFRGNYLGLRLVRAFNVSQGEKEGHRKGRIEDKNIMIHLGKEGAQGKGENPLDKYFTNSMGMKFAYIPPGTFMMGSPLSDNDEKQHEVTLTKGFYLGTTEVIQGHWQTIMGENPSYFKNCYDCPVESISWDDCQEFISRLNQQEGTNTYRLPTEAEWEYACRAGSKTAFADGDITVTGFGAEPSLDRMGWYFDNADNRTHCVAQKNPNVWGLYDMHGNVWEWCQDWYGDYSSGAVIGPKGPSSGMHRVGRGGSWYFSAGFCRSANRTNLRMANRSNYLGFRLARTLNMPVKKEGPKVIRLFVDTVPSGATIKIMNIKPRFCQGIELAPGRYKVQVSAAGYRTHIKWISLAAGEDKKISISLTKGIDPPLGKHFTNTIGMNFVYIPSGTFMMGSPPSEKENDDDENQHKVTITKGLYLGANEVTQGKWKAIMDTNPSSFKDCGDDCPVVNVSWDDCQEFIRRLNQKEKTKKYRLPTEAEWEYACRAKGKKAFANGGITETGCGNEPNLDKMGWYCGNSDKRPHPVAKKKPNTWGVCDMHGNVWEWCQDKCKWKDKIITDTYRGAVVDPLCNIGPSRVNRGGGWGSGARGCRSANRRSNRPDFRVNDLGFRLARTP